MLLMPAPESASSSKDTIRLTSRYNAEILDSCLHKSLTLSRWLLPLVTTQNWFFVGLMQSIINLPEPSKSTKPRGPKGNTPDKADSHHKRSENIIGASISAGHFLSHSIINRKRFAIVLLFGGKGLPISSTVEKEAENAPTTKCRDIGSRLECLSSGKVNQGHDPPPIFQKEALRT